MDETSEKDAAPRYDIQYWIDPGNVIVDIGPGWYDFACSNDATGLHPRKVIGRSLMSFVQGDVTRMYVQTLIQSARLQRKPLVRPYRCDSPDTRRFMEMRLRVEDSGLLCWEHRLLREEPMRQRVNFLPLSPVTLRHCVVRCSMCNRLKSPAGWQEPDDPLNGFAPDEGVAVIHGVCPDCLSQPLGRAGRP